MKIQIRWWKSKQNEDFLRKILFPFFLDDLSLSCHKERSSHQFLGSQWCRSAISIFTYFISSDCNIVLFRRMFCKYCLKYKPGPFSNKTCSSRDAGEIQHRGDEKLTQTLLGPLTDWLIQEQNDWLTERLTESLELLSH